MRRLAGRPAETAVDLIRAGKAGAIYAGRMEYGPRALGARSIIASPPDQAINDSLNKRLRAPSSCRSRRSCRRRTPRRVFEIAAVNRYAARFMTITCAVQPEWRARIPAVVHVDGTARPQIVRDEDNPLFAAILRRFRDATGLPVLVNTSFNVHEEPIVNRPEECRRRCRRTGRFRRDAAGGVREGVNCKRAISGTPDKRKSSACPARCA